MSPDVLTLGETMIAFRSESPISHGGTQVSRVAGAESNVAVGLARLGHAVAWVGRVGADGFGSLVLRVLRGEGVDTDHVVVDPSRPTGLMFVEQRTADVTRVEYRRSASAGSALRREDVEVALAQRPRLLHLTGITTALSRSARDCVLWAAETANAAGSMVTLDVNYRSRLWSREQAREVLTPLAEHTAYVIASEDELDLVAGGPEADAVGELLGRGVLAVAVKRGARGASLYTRAGRVDLPALPVTALDPVGAGDAFCAGLLSGVLDGLEPAESLRRATVTGAFAASVRGDWEGAPTRAELPLLDQHAPGATLR